MERGTLWGKKRNWEDFNSLTSTKWGLYSIKKKIKAVNGMR
jgi:hypothetical protein